MTRLASENRRLRAKLRALREETQPVVDERKQQVAELNATISTLRSDAAVREQELGEQQRRRRQEAATLKAVERMLAALAAAAGGTVVCDGLLVRNLEQLKYGLKWSEGAGGVTLTLTIDPPGEPARRLVYDNLLRLIAANRKK